MNVHNVDSAFEILKRYNITSNKESIRRWLRQGDLKGITPTFRKDGWKIREDDLLNFIKKRIPNETNMNPLNKTTNVVLKKGYTDKEAIRATMWWEIVRKNIFEDFIEIKKKRLHECVEHRGHSKEFEQYVWEEIQKNKGRYTTPRIPYLLDAFLFGSERILMDQNYESTEEKIIFSLIEYLRKKKVER